MAKKIFRNARKSRREEEGIEEMPALRGGRRGGGASAYEEKEYSEILREFLTSPAVKYVAGGIAAAMLARLANNLNDKYPEISNFIRENLDTIENKLDEFKSGIGGGEYSRH